MDSDYTLYDLGGLLGFIFWGLFFGGFLFCFYKLLIFPLSCSCCLAVTTPSPLHCIL